MIQYGLDISISLRGYFTLEKYLVDLNLYQIEDKLGYEKGRLKQGADFYILSPPNHPSDFEVLGTSVFPGHRFEDSNLQKTINNQDKKRRDLNLFRRKRIIKVVPLQIHIEAMRKYLKDEEYHLIKDINTHGMSQTEFLQSIQAKYRNNTTLIRQIQENFAKVNDIYKHRTDINDSMYPSATGGGVPQWKLNRTLPGRCVCRLTDYHEDIYQRVF